MRIYALTVPKAGMVLVLTLRLRQVNLMAKEIPSSDCPQLSCRWRLMVCG